MKFNSLFVAEYSARQNAFHVEPVGNMICTNVRILSTGGRTDYVPFAIYDTAEEAKAACDAARDALIDDPEREQELIDLPLAESVNAFINRAIDEAVKRNKSE